MKKICLMVREVMFRPKGGIRRLCINFPKLVEPPAFEFPDELGKQFLRPGGTQDIDLL